MPHVVSSIRLSNVDHSLAKVFPFEKTKEGGPHVLEALCNVHLVFDLSL